MRDDWRLRDVSHGQYGGLPRLDRPAGYLLLIHDVEVSGRYRSELTDSPSRRWPELQETLPVETEVIIIIQSEDVEATDRYFQLLFEESWRRKSWFDLDDSQVTLIRRMVALQDPDSIYYADRLPLAAWNGQPMTRLSHSRLWSLPPEEYRTMPALGAPAGYICVVRDARGNIFRLEHTQSPQEFVDALLDDEKRPFGIELVALLGTDYVRESETYLHDKYGASFGEEWLTFDEYQLKHLKDSVLQSNKHKTCYVFPD